MGEGDKGVAEVDFLRLFLELDELVILSLSDDALF